MEKGIRDMIRSLTKSINFIRKTYDDYDEFEYGQLSAMVNIRDRLVFILNKNGK